MTPDEKCAVEAFISKVRELHRSSLSFKQKAETERAYYNRTGLPSCLLRMDEMERVHDYVERKLNKTIREFEDAYVKPKRKKKQAKGDMVSPKTN